MTERDYVKSIHLFAERNNLRGILEVQTRPYNGKAVVSSRCGLRSRSRFSRLRC